MPSSVRWTFGSGVRTKRDAISVRVSFAISKQRVVHALEVAANRDVEHRDLRRIGHDVDAVDTSRARRRSPSPCARTTACAAAPRRGLARPTARSARTSTAVRRGGSARRAPPRSRPPARRARSRRARRDPCRARRRRCRRARRSRAAAAGRTAPHCQRRAPSRCSATPFARAHAACARSSRPRGQLPAEVALRQLEQQRPDRLLHLVEIGSRDQAVAVADRTRVQAVEVLVAALLVHVEVALRMERDGRAAAALAPDPQRDLLRHRAAREESGRLFPEQLGDTLLEALDALAGSRRGRAARPRGRRAREAPRPDRAARSTRGRSARSARRSARVPVGPSPEPTIAGVDFETRAIHEGQEPDPATGAIITPIYQTSTYVQDAVGEHKGYDYSRVANPTRHGARDGARLARVGRARRRLLVRPRRDDDAHAPPRIPGDRVVLIADVYGGVYRMTSQVYEPKGYRFDYLPAEEFPNLARAPRRHRRGWSGSSRRRTRCSTSSTSAPRPRRRTRSGALLVVDNTFATPYLQRPLELGADVVVHSTTKYLGGHSDVVGGFAATNDPTVAERLRFLQKSLGAVPGPFDCWLVLRGIKTLAVRMRQHCENAMADRGAGSSGTRASSASSTRGCRRIPATRSRRGRCATSAAWSRSSPSRRRRRRRSSRARGSSSSPSRSAASRA